LALFGDEIPIALNIFSTFLHFFRHQVDERFVEFCFRFPSLAESVELLSEIMSCEGGFELALALDLASILPGMKRDRAVPPAASRGRLAVQSDAEFRLFDWPEFFADLGESF
jgi:hypothetical protein